MARQKVPVTMKALVQRINRKLNHERWPQALKKTRGTQAVLNLGDWYVLDVRRNAVANLNVNPESLGRELGVLADWEALVEEE